MNDIEGIDELKDEWKSDNPPSEEIFEGASPPWDGRALETMNRIEADALLADVFGEVPPEDTEVSDCKDKIRFEDGDIGLERLAGEIHQTWCMWMENLFREGHFENGPWVMDAAARKRWTRQMITPYSQLTEGEKGRGRDIARRYLNIAYLIENEDEG